MKLSRSLFLFALLFLAIAGDAQLPVCSGPGSNIIYFVGDTVNIAYTGIYNYDPSLPISSTNPSLNSISLPTGSTGALSVNENINASSPSPTFYTVVLNQVSNNHYFMIYYYNGNTWVNTGDTVGGSALPYNVTGLAGGGGYLYVVQFNTWKIYKYDGTGNAPLLVTLPATTYTSTDIAADCNGNFYTIGTYPGAASLRKYNSGGTQTQSWTLTGTHINTSVDGFTIIGNRIYYSVINGTPPNVIDTLWTGIIGTSSTIGVNTMGSIYISPNTVPASLSSCPIGTNVATVNTPLANYDCNTGQPDTLIAYGASPFTWSVLSGPAVISGMGDTVTVTSSGNSTIQVTSSAFVYCGNNTQTITLNYTPLDTTLITTNAPLCVGDTLHLNGLNAVGATYTWSGPVSYSSSGPHANRPGMVMADSGYYKLSISFNGCSGSDSVLVNVRPLPDIPLMSSNSPICAGDTLKLHATDTSAGVSYSWSGPVSFSASSQNPIRLNAQTTYSGTYTAIAHLNGCTTSASTNVTVNPQLGPPTISISVLPGDTICAGSSINFSASVTNAGSPQYHWKKNNTGIGPNASTYSTTTAISGDIFTCEVQSNLNCQATDTAASNAITMYVTPLTTPSVNITSQPIIIIPLHTDTFTANVSNCTNPSYQWYRNGVLINSATMNPYITSLFNGDILTVTVHCTGCANPDTAVSNSLTTGIAAPGLLTRELQVYPNPFTDQLNIHYTSSPSERPGEVLIHIYDIVGREVYRATVNTSSPLERSGEVSINTALFVPGSYILELIATDGSRQIRKINK